MPECAICKKEVPKTEIKKLYSLGEHDEVCLTCFSKYFKQEGDWITLK